MTKGINNLRFPVLNFPSYAFRIKATEEAGVSVFDVCRKKFVALNPEEWVRQHLIHFLHREKGVPLSLMAIERSLKLYNTRKRTDVLVYSNTQQPWLIAECKAPDVPLNQQVLDQVLRYNLVFGVSYVVLSNGLQHYCCGRAKDGTITALSDFPDFIRK